MLDFVHVDRSICYYCLSAMTTRDILTRLRQLDAYPKTLEDFRIKTFSGATGEVLGSGATNY